MYLLLVDDDERLTRLLDHLLRQAGHTVDVAHDGRVAAALMAEGDYDLLVLDWMLPHEAGISLCRRARAEGFEGGILMLTARDALEDRLEGFAAGADDYLLKPFEPDELLARLAALGRRARRPLDGRRLQVGDWVLECDERRVEHGGRAVELTQREFQLLELLMRRAGHSVPRELIYERLWGRDQVVTDNALDATLRLLRRKLKRVTARQPIETLRGLGYRFDEGS
ncbi:response regulator transcription factor [Halomonas mongoliensis]|uniref:Response regulator transcription factor n=1 Tax=Halomonas mongoliensis TaxID=321265 RepID=A0ABU1GGV1_9GAMM|nr:response regulator transcription factor [Halomonas mongoliensis]MDR5891213.1 response regulator transcription factor [Halomonas mongoliensis]